MSTADRNLEIYNAPEVVGHYTAKSELKDCEPYLFTKYILPGTAILDIGVGGGRTTPCLSAKAATYTGVDYSQAMVAACRKRFPALTFFCENACDLRRFADASFDSVVFSFNGIDYIRSDEERFLALREIARVLKPGGRFIFSSHNAKWLGVWPVLDGGDPIRKVWRVVRALGQTIALAARRLRSPSFARGAGYEFDPEHGGLEIFFSTPETMCSEVESAGFVVVEVINMFHPRPVSRFFTLWYYYVVTKR